MADQFVHRFGVDVVSLGELPFEFGDLFFPVKHRHRLFERELHTFGGVVADRGGDHRRNEPFVAALGKHVGGKALDHFIVVGHAECDGFDKVVVTAFREVHECLHAQLVAVAFAEDTQQFRRRKIAVAEELFDGQCLQGGIAAVRKKPFPRRGAVLPEQFVHVNPLVGRREAESRVADQVLFQIGGVFGQVADAHAQSREAHVAVHPFVLQYVHRVGQHGDGAPRAENVGVGDAAVAVE